MKKKRSKEPAGSGSAPAAQGFCNTLSLLVRMNKIHKK